MPTYLDYMSTTPVDFRVVEIMRGYMMSGGVFGNPASEHFYGLAASAAVDEAWAHIKSLINSTAAEDDIIWTSGATESNNLAIKGAAQFYQRQGRHIVTTSIEHQSVLATCKYLEKCGFTVSYVAPESNGLINISKLGAAIKNDTILISVAHVNSEIGVIQNIDEIGRITRSKGILFHVDAAQSVGRISVDVQKSNIDLMSISAHKFYGPKGIGALYVRGAPSRICLEQQIHGGGQSVRAGTLPVHQIVGIGEASRIAKIEIEKDDERGRFLTFRDCFLDRLLNIDGIILNGDLEHRIPCNLNFSFDGIDGDVLMSALSAEIALSRASSCSVAKMEPSHVLMAIGRSRKLAATSVRISFGRWTTIKEIDFASKHMRNVILKLYDRA